MIMDIIRPFNIIYIFRKLEQRQVYFILMFIILLVSAIAFFRYRVTEHGYCVSLYSNLPVRKYTICLLQNSIIATISI